MADEVEVDANYDEFEQGDYDDDEVSAMKAKATKKKGRGVTDVVDEGPTGGALRSIEGWILFATGIHEEAQEDDVFDKFSEYGMIKNIHVNLDRRTGYLKGYALIEYETFKEAQAAIDNLNSSDLLGQTIKVDWAFVKPPAQDRRRSTGGGRY